jgi:hypothetical protein
MNAQARGQVAELEHDLKSRIIGFIGWVTIISVVGINVGWMVSVWFLVRGEGNLAILTALITGISNTISLGIGYLAGSLSPSAFANVQNALRQPNERLGDRGKAVFKVEADKPLPVTEVEPKSTDPSNSKQSNDVDNNQQEEDSLFGEKG